MTPGFGTVAAPRPSTSSCGRQFSADSLRSLLLLALLAPLCAHAIVNGAPVSAERFAADFGWAIAVENPASGGVCTGELISPTWVLTAAHCVGGPVRVLAGNRDRALAAVLPSAEVIVHPFYDGKTAGNDVGLIRLQAPAAPAPVRIATRREADALLKPNALAVIAGWGKRSPSLPFSGQLIVSDVELRSLTRQDSMFIYFDPVSGPCGGDSGGPLLLAGPDGGLLLVGIASRVVGDLCARGGGIGIYADVAAVRAFVETYVKDLPLHKSLVDGRSRRE